MAFSPRTPEGFSKECPICGKPLLFDPCPYCLWWERKLTERYIHQPVMGVATSSIVNDLWPDSLDVAKMLMEHEEMWDFTIPDEARKTLRTVEEVVEFIEDHFRKSTP